MKAEVIEAAGGRWRLLGRRTPPSAGAQRCQRKFLRYFPRGFADPKYVAWERGYKWSAHEQWEAELGAPAFAALLKAKAFPEIARRAVRIESRTNLLFSFEKMAIRDAVKPPAGARAFAEGLFALLHGAGSPGDRFDRWCGVVAGLPRRQTRVLTWPVATVFAFLARPEEFIYLKPTVTRVAAEAYGFAFPYQSRPNGRTYGELLGFAATIARDLRDLAPRDLIDVQSFIWVQGSAEYPA